MKARMTRNSILIYFFLIGIIIYNFYLHGAELSIKSEVNDNIFQYALVDEAKVIWKSVLSFKLSPFYLIDSFNERWNEGFALSTYYSHLPQAVISLISIVTTIPTETVFNIVKFIFLILLPVSFFIGARALRFSYLYSILTAYLSHIIMTDGLYGIDVTSFLFRGWGLSAQLMAVFFLPMAFAYSYRYLTDGKYLGRALLFNFLLAQSHSGVFLMMALGYAIVGFSAMFRDQDFLESPRTTTNVGSFGLRLLKHPLSAKILTTPVMAIYNRLDLSSVAIRRLCIFGFWLFLLLSYYFVPFFLYSQYRSFSYWDPLWKFNSFGLFQILTWVLNGELFDLNRLPLMTLSVFAGFFAVFVTKNRRMRLFGLLFIFYFIFFLGRVSPFGKAIDLIPGFSEFHLHRFIVMVQFIGIFLAAFWLESGINKIRAYLKKVSLIKIEVPIREILVTVIFICSIIIFRYLEKPVIEYSKFNREWIAQGNILYQKDEKAYRQLSAAIRGSNPARIYAGRPGNWGRDLKVADTAIYMALSRDGYKGLGFAPESWSPNSEFDQFFNENDINSYRLYNVTHAVYPDNLTIPKFFKLIGKFGKFYLYRIKTDGWFSAGTSSSLINSNKTHLFNIVHFWMTTDGVKNNEYPQISFGKTENNLGKNYIRMADLNRYYSGNDKTQKRLWEKNPLYDGHDSQASRLVKTGEKALISGYSATFKLTKDCSYCVAVLKQTYHPNWQIKVNEEPVKTYPVFPFYIGIPIQKAGSYKIEAVYRPNSLKIGLLIITVMVTVVYLFRKKLVFFREI